MSSVPVEPDQVRIWRAIIARRDALVAELERWTSPDHPIAQYHAHVAAVHGGHGLSNDRLRRNDAEALEVADSIRKRIEAMDRTLEIARYEPNEAGLSMRQLEKLLEADIDESVQVAEAAVLEWLRGPTAYTSRNARERLGAVRGPRGYLFQEELEALAKQARSSRNGGSGKHDRLARRIVKLAMEGR